MTKIKLCGLSRERDIEAANELIPEYVGFVFAPKSRRYVTPETAEKLRSRLSPNIKTVGVFVDESCETVANLLCGNIIDIAQLHGSEDENYIKTLRDRTERPIIKAFRINTADDIKAVNDSGADFVLLDSGAGTGKLFDWELIQSIKRPYFLAGGLTPENVETAVKKLKPYAVDVSSGIETDGVKDTEKMAAFVDAVRRI